MALFYPGTSTLVTHSYEERFTRIAEFDDALLDQASWKNARYEGSKLSGKEINKYTATNTRIDTENTSSGEYLGKFVNISGSTDLFWGGDTSIDNLPVVNKLVTALYISNTIIGGDENSNYVTLKNHSYVAYLLCPYAFLLYPLNFIKLGYLSLPFSFIHASGIILS